MQKTVYIVGPTGVGKSSFALELAKHFNGAIISADSVQVFKGLDIISGKDLPKTSKFVPLPNLYQDGYNSGCFLYNDISIFLLDVVGSHLSFSVAQFYDLAIKSIEFVVSQNKLPIVVGGTGLYIEALLNGLNAIAEPDKALRKTLTKLTVTELQKKLQSLDDKKFRDLNDSDRANTRRLIRAIEVFNSQTPNSKPLIPSFKSMVFGLTCDRAALKQRIDRRVEDRLKEGAIKEAKMLFKDYQNLSQQVKDANGYKQLFAYLQHELSLEEAIYRWKISEYHHAKNQMTWFRKYGNVEWFDITNLNFKKEIKKRIRTFPQ